MIERYTRPEMGAVWSEQRKLDTWLAVELAVVEALAEAGVVPAEDAAEIRDRASFTVEAVKEREKVTDHDVAAFVDVVAASVGEAGRWVHHGLTSSDVLDTALALQLSQAGLILAAGARDFRDALVRRAREHEDTLCVGRTHGVHAEPTTFGVKLAGFAFEADRNLHRLERAVEATSVGALSGAVGTYAANGPELEEAVLGRLGLAREDASTQVVARDRHAELLSAIASAGAGLERFATEIRHLQRTEVREVEEPFREGQKGSSAMPHKRNPIVTRADHGHRAAAARLRAGGPGERGAVARARHLALLGRAGGAARRHDPARLRAAPRGAGGGRDDRARRPHAQEPRPHPRRALLPARAAGAGGVGQVARRRLPDRAGERPARLGDGHAVPRSARPGGARAGPRRGVRPRGRSCATRPRSLDAWTGSRAGDSSPAPQTADASPCEADSRSRSMPGGGAGRRRSGWHRPTPPRARSSPSSRRSSAA